MHRHTFVIILLALAAAAVQTPRARGVGLDRTPSAQDRARAAKEFKRRLDEHRALRKKQIDDFAAANPAPPGSDDDFPYFRLLTPVIEPVPGVTEPPAACITRDYAYVEMWCNGAGGPAAVRGRKIMAIFDIETQVSCGRRLDGEDGAVAGSVFGIHTWRREGDMLYLDDVRFRIGPARPACKRIR
jgi:hypothetical protein